MEGLSLVYKFLELTNLMEKNTRPKARFSTVAHGEFNPCIQAFGADQFDGEESKAQSSFFNWWNFGVCGAVSVILLILIYIQDNLSWGLGFGTDFDLFSG